MFISFLNLFVYMQIVGGIVFFTCFIHVIKEL